MALARWERPALIENANGYLVVVGAVWCEVRTEAAGNALADLFEDRDGATPLSNPFQALDGVPGFHVAGGSYRVRLYTTGYDETFRYQAIGTAAELDTDDLSLLLPFTAASGSGPARFELAEDTDNGSSTGTLTVPAALGGDRTYTLPDADMTISAFMAGMMAAASAAALQAAAGLREVLTANRTYYVRSDGSNSNTGLADSSGGAFLTLAKAMAVVATIDFNGYTVTVQIKDGTFAGATVPVTMGQAGVANLVIQGNSSTPANVAITSAISLGAGARATIKDLAITSSGHGLVVDGAGAACAFSNIAFGACTNAQIYAASGATVTMTGNCSFTGSSQVRVWARWNAVYVEEFRTCTYSSTPAYSVANMYILSGATVSSAVSTQTGSATGVRYNVQGGALLETGGGGASFYPGNSAGSTATGGQYT